MSTKPNTKYSRLVYEAVKDSITIPNGEMTYDSFMHIAAGNGQVGMDWSFQFSAVFSALNLGLSRLADENKLLYCHKDLAVGSEGKVSFSEDGSPLGRAIAVVCRSSRSYKNLAFRTLDAGRVLALLGDYPSKVTVEYQRELPVFGIEDLDISDPNWEDIDLSEWGVTARGIQYLKEFAKAQMIEYIAPDQAARHNALAEQYFSSMPDANSAFVQHEVVDYFEETFETIVPGVYRNKKGNPISEWVSFDEED